MPKPANYYHNKQTWMKMKYELDVKKLYLEEFKESYPELEGRKALMIKQKMVEIELLELDIKRFEKNYLTEIKDDGFVLTVSPHLV